MCAVRALWISCCNHFYLLNYVKPFFYPTSVSLFISFSLPLSLCHGLIFFNITGTIKARGRGWCGRFQPETACWELSVWMAAGRDSIIQRNLSVSKRALYKGRHALAAPKRTCRRISTKLSSFWGPFFITFHHNLLSIGQRHYSSDGGII